MKFFSIDRIEGHEAICIDDSCRKHIINIKKLPKNAKETDVLYLSPDNEFLIAKKETKLRHQKSKKLENSLNIT
jgi:hypothetical protein